MDCRLRKAPKHHHIISPKWVKFGLVSLARLKTTKHFSSVEVSTCPVCAVLQHALLRKEDFTKFILMQVKVLSMPLWSPLNRLSGPETQSKTQKTCGRGKGSWHYMEIRTLNGRTKLTINSESTPLSNWNVEHAAISESLEYTWLKVETSTSKQQGFLASTSTGNRT